MKKMVISLLVIVAFALSVYAFVPAWFTGKYYSGRSVTGVRTITCQYRANGNQLFWRTFDATQTYVCPQSIEVY